MRYVDYVYDIIDREQHDLEALYGDYIMAMVGLFGFNALIEHHLLETCGVVNGRQIYALCDKK